MIKHKWTVGEYRIVQEPGQDYVRGESLIRKRVRTCSEINSMAGRLAKGSDCAK